MSEGIGGNAAFRHRSDREGSDYDRRAAAHNASSASSASGSEIARGRYSRPIRYLQLAAYQQAHPPRRVQRACGRGGGSVRSKLFG